MIEWLFVAGLIILLLGMLGYAWQPLRQFSSNALLLGIVLMLLSAVLMGLTAVFDFLIKYWFIIVPIAGFSVFYYLYKEQPQLYGG